MFLYGTSKKFMEAISTLIRYFTLTNLSQYFHEVSMLQELSSKNLHATLQCPKKSYEVLLTSIPSPPEIIRKPMVF